MKNAQVTAKKRVLFIGPYPPPYSGPDVAMKSLLESSLADKYDILFINTNIRKSNSERGRVGLATLVAFPILILKLVALEVFKRPKLVYYFVTATRYGWVGRDAWFILLSRLLVGKVVIHMRAGHFKKSYSSCSKIEQTLIRFACSHTAKGIVQANNLREQFSGLVPEERIAVVYNSVDTNLYCNGDPLNYDRNCILFLGHLSYAKGYCDLLKIIPRIASRHPDVCFYFAGTPLKQERNVFHNQITGETLQFEEPDVCFEKYIRGSFEKNYKYLGIVSGQEKLDMLRRCNFLVLPSYSEGFSMAALEAMAMAKPVVCTPVGALGEVIKTGVNGLLVSPGDTEQLADSILKLLEDPQARDEYAQTNDKYVREVFSIEIIVEQLAEQFESVLKNPRHNSRGD